MGTRGTIGFRKNETDKLAYNHWDSYPTGIGIDIVNAIRELTVEKIEELVDRLKVVNDDTTPTEEDIEKLKLYTDLSVSTQSEKEWYCLLRDTQGDIKKILESGYLLEANNFINDSLFCEWGYIINLDTKKLEIYRGFQKKRPTKSRYKDFTPEPDGSNASKYYACELIEEYELKKLEWLNEYDVEPLMKNLEEFTEKKEESE